jgi:hypothetical protein
VRDFAAGDARADAAGAEQTSVLVDVVAAVGEQLAGLASRPATPSADRRYRIEQRQQLGDVVAVPAGQRDRERDAVGFDDQVVLRGWPRLTGEGPTSPLERVHMRSVHRAAIQIELTRGA